MDEIRSHKEIEDEGSPSITENPIIDNPTTTKRPITEDTQPGEPRIKKPRKSISIQYIDPSIHLTTVQRAPSAHNVGCVSLESLIGDADLDLMVQINYMIDIDFVMSKDMDTDIRIRYPRITMRKVPVPGIGTHHTKAMLLFYRDNTMQLIIHTANMIEQDWRNKTQAAFTTGRLSKKVQGPGLPTCAFERDLLEYLERYNNREITNRISQFDFTGVKGVLVGSVPGKHEGAEKNKWGHLKLRTVLRQQVSIPRDLIQGSKVICQISSIGSLGKCSQDWLKGEFEASLNAHRDKVPGNADLCVIYPTAEDVRTSGRERAMPHIKEPYEPGENIHVQMMNATVADPYPEPSTTLLNAECDQTNDDYGISIVPIRLPYDLPLLKYDHNRDKVWLADKFFSGQDDFGNVLRR
ncbi:tyrosyl-DNA phosphodiesterase 1 [Haplosporangium sp. Z 767]|nr:tyrosyl-DNA phosphodiesterase 1 [Haplosporangium sp. Z 767]